MSKTESLRHGVHRWRPSGAVDCGIPITNTAPRVTGFDDRVTCKKCLRLIAEHRELDRKRKQELVELGKSWGGQ